MTRSSVFVFAFLVALASGAEATLLKLADGTVLTGKVTRVAPPTWRIETRDGETRLVFFEELTEEFKARVAKRIPLRDGSERWVIGMSRARFVRELVDQAGGALVVAHPFRRRILKVGDPDNERYRKELDRACRNPLFGTADAIEVLNARGDNRQNAFSRELAERLNLPGVGGSDAHEPDEVGHVATEFEKKITNLEEFITELKAGRCRAVSL